MNIKYVLLGEKSYVVGRRDCDILVQGDPTVSRKHAELTMSHPEINLVNVTKLPILLLKDLSKFGTWVNKERVSGEKLLTDGDEITFGSTKSLYTVVYEPMVITSSCLDAAGKKLVRQKLSILGGHMVNEWSSDCSLVVMNRISVTIKVICALVSLKPVVLPSYLEQYVKHLQGTSEKPDPSAYTPALAETQLDPNEVSFAPDIRRKTLFQGMRFVFLCQKQLKKLNQAIELAGGMALLMETEGDDRILTEPGTVVMQYQETDVTPKTEKWVKQVQDLLERNGKHMIQDAEIGYAVLYGSTEKHCNPDYTPDHELSRSRLPSQTLSQADADAYVASTETQHRTQTPGKVHTNTRSTKKTSTKTSSPDPVEQRKSSKYNRSPSPAKPSSPVPQETKRSAKRSPSPAPATPLSRGPGKRLKTTRHGSSSPDLEVTETVKAEPISQHEPAAVSKKRNRPVIEEDSSDDDEFSVPRSLKRVKVEPKTPRSKTGAVEKKKPGVVSQYTTNSDDNEDESIDEFDRIDARMNSRRKRKPSPKPQGQRSPHISPRVSPARQKGSNSRSPSPRTDTVTKASQRIKTETADDGSWGSDLEPGTARGKSGRGQTRSDDDSASEPTDRGSKSGRRGAKSTEIASKDYEMSSAVPIQDSEDIKPTVVSGVVTSGFLTTTRPIADQVLCNREFEPEPDQPSKCIKVEYESLVIRKPPAKEKNNSDCRDGFSRWKGKVVKNFKKFRKIHSSVQVGLPTVIGGSDLEVYVPQRSKEMDDWFRESMQAESQHASEDRRAQELFDFDPSKRRRR